MHPHLLDRSWVFGPRNAARKLVWQCLVLGIGMVLVSGCTRARYRTAADDDSYRIIGEKASATPWDVPRGFSINPDPRSRLYRPDNPDDPALPVPAPVLYDYELPYVPERDPARFRGEVDSGNGLDSGYEVLPLPPSVPPQDGPELNDPYHGPAGQLNAPEQARWSGGHAMPSGQQRYPIESSTAHQNLDPQGGQLAPRVANAVARGSRIETSMGVASEYDLIAYKSYEPGGQSAPVATLGGIRLGLQKALVQSERRIDQDKAATLAPRDHETVRESAGVAEPILAGMLPDGTKLIPPRTRAEMLPSPVSQTHGVVTSAPPSGSPDLFTSSRPGTGRRSAAGRPSRRNGENRTDSNVGVAGPARFLLASHARI